MLKIKISLIEYCTTRILAFQSDWLFIKQMCPSLDPSRLLMTTVTPATIAGQISQIGLGGSPIRASNGGSKRKKRTSNQKVFFIVFVKTGKPNVEAAQNKLFVCLPYRSFRDLSEVKGAVECDGTVCQASLSNDINCHAFLPR